MAFELAYTLHGGDAHKLTLDIKSGQTLKAGMLIELDAGEAKVAVTDSTDVLGVCTGIDANGKAVVVVDPAAVYRVADATVRLLGASLDIAAGGLTVAAPGTLKDDLVVVGKSPANGPTLVKIATSKHAFSAA